MADVGPHVAPVHLPAAVIFDMDGVLLDSEPLHFDALNQVLGSEGFALTEADNEAILGTTLEGTFDHIAGRYPLKRDREAYYSSYDSTVLEILARPLQPSPGVLDLLGRLEKLGLPVAVASSSRRSWVETSLRSLGIRSCFRVIVTGDDIRHGKPNPEIYLRTAATLGVQAPDCVAIEDAPNGIRSARRAGMRVIAVRTAYTAHLDLSEADVVVSTLESVGLSEMATIPQAS